MVIGLYKNFLKYPSWKKITLLGAIFIFVFYFFPLIWHASEIIFAPYDIDIMEGVVLNGAVNLFNKKTIYPQLDSYPYVPVIYPPVFHLTTAFFFIPIFGKSFASIRMLSFLSSLLAVFFIYKILFYKTRKRLLSAFIPLLLLTSRYVYWWAPFGRIDWLAVAFGLIGLYLVIKYEDSGKIFLSIPFFILAIFTKQTFFIEPLAVSLYLFLKGKKRYSLIFSFLFLLVSGAIFLTLQFITKGMFFIQVFEIMRGVPSKFAISKSRWVRFFSFYPVPLSLGAFATLVGLRGILKKKPELFSLCFLFSFIIAVYSLGRGGAGENYLFEVITFSYILMGLLLDRILNKKTLPFKIIGVILILIIILGHSSHFYPINGVTWSPLKLHLVYSVPKGNIKRLVDTVIKNTDGKVLVDNELGYLAKNNKQVLIDPLNMNHAEREGLWDFKGSELARDLKNKNIPLIVIAQKYLSSSIVDQIHKNYNLVAVGGPYFLYKPVDRYVKNALLRELLWQDYLFRKQKQDGKFSLDKKFGMLNDWQFRPYFSTGNIKIVHHGFYVKYKDSPGQIIWKIPSFLKKGKVKTAINLNNSFYKTGLYLSTNGQEWEGRSIDTSGKYEIELDLPSGIPEIYIKWEITPVDEIINSHDSAAIIKSIEIKGEGGGVSGEAYLIFHNQLLRQIYKELIDQGILTSVSQTNEVLKSALDDVELFSHQLGLSLDLLEIKNNVIDYTQLKGEAIRIFGTKSQLALWENTLSRDLYEQLLTSYDFAVSRKKQSAGEDVQ